MIITLENGEQIHVSPYDGTPVLDRGCPLNLLKGQRGVGKTFFYKKRGITRGYKDGKKFVWLRRYETEIDTKFRNDFLADIIKAANDPLSEFSDADRKLFHAPEYSLKNGDITFNGKHVGYYRALSKQAQNKSTSFHDVDDLYFDEYLIMPGSNLHYIPDEYSKFLELYSTIARTRPGFHAYLIGNNMSWADPYTLALRIKPTKDRFTKIKNPANNKTIALLEMYTDRQFADALYKTAFGQLVQGTQYGNYAIENESLTDNEDFIAQRSPTSYFRFALRYNGIYYGFWLDQQQGIMYVNTKCDHTSPNIYSLNRDDHTINTYLITHKRSIYVMRELATLYKTGNLYFDTVTTKAQVTDALALLL